MTTTINSMNNLPQPKLMQVIDKIAAKPNLCHYVLMRGTESQNGYLLSEILRLTFDRKPVMISRGCDDYYLTSDSLYGENAMKALQMVKEGKADVVIACDPKFFLNGEWTAVNKKRSAVHCTYELSKSDREMLNAIIRSPAKSPKPAPKAWKKVGVHAFEDIEALLLANGFAPSPYNLQSLDHPVFHRDNRMFRIRWNDEIVDVSETMDKFDRWANSRELELSIEEFVSEVKNKNHEWGPPYECKFCGQPSYVDPSDQSPPADYCTESDHTNHL